VDFEWVLLLSLFFSFANKKDVVPNKNKAKIPDMKVLMPTSVFWTEKISVVG